MKIISDFKDYYDYIAGYDTDPRKVYVRRREEFYPYDKVLQERVGEDNVKLLRRLSNTNIYLTPKKGHVRRFTSDIYKHGALLFCNKLYRYIKEIKNTEIITYHWNDSVITEEFRRYYVNNSFFPKISWDGYFDPLEYNINTATNIPIIHCNGREIVINECLKSIDFSKLKSPQEVFTEIYNFIPYVEPELPMGGPEDMIRWEQKGFDKKTSFRNVK